MITNSAKKILISMVMVFMALSVLPNCKEDSSRKISHVVLVWLKDDNKQEVLARIMNETLELRKIPEVKKIHMGNAIPSDRDIVDSSFDLGLVMEFNSVDDMKKYLDHPLHREFFKKSVKNFAKKIVVYDF